jgi:glycosyltransferase involved in cell wall biosynthesis
MPKLSDIQALVLTYNESPNIARTLDGLRAIGRVVVLDSGSTDDTIAICQTYQNVEIHQRAFDNFAAQCNHALDKLFANADWILSLDADYDCPPSLVQEMAQLDNCASAYCVAFIYCIDGRAIPGTLYPPRPVLFRKAMARYIQDGHAHRLLVDGKVQALREKIRHDDRKSFAFWFANQRKYARQEAIHLSNKPRAQLRLQDRLRLRRWIAPWLVPLYCLVAKGLLFAGPAGWKYVRERFLFERELARELKSLSHS